jgi:WD40 repeat protein
MIKAREDGENKDCLSTLTGSYLDSHNFNQNLSAPVLETLHEMADEANMETETGTSRSTLAMCSSFTDPTQYDRQFADLRAFVASYSGKDAGELKRLLEKVFSHLYVDASQRGAPRLAEALLDKYGDGFSDDLIKRVRQSIISSQNGKALEQADVVLSQETTSSLMHFIGKRQSVLLRTIIERCCKIRVIKKDGLSHQSNISTSQVFGDGDKEEIGHQDRLLGKEQSAVGETAETEPERNKAVYLQSVIHRMKEVQEPSALPSVCLYTFYNVSHLGLTNIMFSPDATLLCGTFEDSSVRLWNRLEETVKESMEVDETRFDVSHPSLNIPASIRLQEMNEQGNTEQETDSLILRGHSSEVYSASFTSDSHYLVSASGDTSVRLWDITTQHNVALYKGHAWPVWDVAFSKFDYYFATASFDRTARLWQTDIISSLRIFAGHTASVNCVEFHPNSTYLATGSSDGTCRLWNVQDGQYVRLFSKHLAPVRTLTFSPDGRELVSAGDDGKLLLWDIGSGNMVSEMISHTDRVSTVSFSLDGLLIASSGYDGTIRLWNAKGLIKETACFTTKSCAIHRVQFCKNNLILAGGVHTSHR